MMKSMSLKARKELLNSMRKRYQEAYWQEKVKLVDGFMAATGYARKYAITQLNCPITQIMPIPVKFTSCSGGKLPPIPTTW